MTFDYFVMFLLFVLLATHHLSVTVAQHNHALGISLEDYKEDVRGIDKSANLFGVAVTNKVLLRRILFPDGRTIFEPAGNIPIEGHSGDLLEFKLINDNSALICTDTGCTVCGATGPDPDCKTLKFDIEGKKFSGIRAEVSPDKIHIRAVRHHGNASFYVFDSANGLRDEPDQVVTDNALMSNITVVGSFSTPGYTYFVGSARRKDLGAINIESIPRENTDVRITRLCHNDQTKQLDSRIDLVLSCEGVDYSDVEKSVVNEATAVSFDAASGTMYVAMQTRVNSKKSNIICSFNFEQDIQQQFDGTWDKCQTKHDNEHTRRTCRSVKDYKNLPDECFVFTFNMNAKLPFCSAFNGEVDEPLKNCDLHRSNSTNSRYGWLENFKPIVGKRVYQSNAEQHYVWLKRTAASEVLFALTSENKLERLLIGQKNEQLMYFPALSGEKTTYFDAENNVLLFTDPRLMTSVNYSKLTCEGLYSGVDCAFLSWQDPLQCVFCADTDGSGSVTDMDESSCVSRIPLRNACPPRLTYTKVDTSSAIIQGEHLDRIVEGTRKVSFCGIDCRITKSTAESINCDLSSSAAGCGTFSYAGKLKNNDGEYVFKKSISDVGTTTAENHKEMKLLRNIAFVVAALVLLALIFLCWYCFGKKFTNSRHAHKPRDRYNPVSSDIPLEPVEENVVGLLRQSQIQTINVIGHGQFAQVHLAKYFPDPKNMENYTEVAVKVLFSPLDGNGDAKKEIELMQSCQHPNILRFIGRVMDDHRIMIVTEYMSGGSVHDYLKKPESRPTIGQCFDYIMNVLSGMVYLSHQHVIHRDLATRNCLLNATHDILKISDFGLSRRANIDYEYMSLGQQRLPVRWLPIETLLNDKKFHVKSDVWSFGIVIWELFTRAEVPYNGMTIAEMTNFLDSGHRLAAPQYCPPHLYDIMLMCWDAKPENRPTFDTLYIRIEKLLETYRRDNASEMDVEYERPVCTPRSTSLVENGVTASGSTETTTV